MGETRFGFLVFVSVLTLLGSSACAGAGEQVLSVKASAYNATPEQTDGDPDIGAWGDRLKPGVRAIAVSRDLLELGMSRGTRVRIEGLPGEYRVMDKMAKRWRRKIDIFMGDDVQGARNWGVREVTIRWTSGSR
jgi:3D (Asp-Asp-Asp) domain-containing protein